jgi:hypothetical protein
MSAKVALDDLIKDTAIKALHESHKVKVTTSDEVFIGYVKTVTQKDETHLIEFVNCKIPNEPYEHKRKYFSFRILEIIILDNDSQESDFEVLTQPNTTQETPMDSQQSQTSPE